MGKTKKSGGIMFGYILGLASAFYVLGDKLTKKIEFPNRSITEATLERSLPSQNSEYNLVIKPDEERNKVFNPLDPSYSLANLPRNEAYRGKKN